MSHSRLRALLTAALIAVWQPSVQPPPRWWHSQRALTSFQLSAADCDAVDRAVEPSLAAQRRASMDAARALNDIASQLDDAFVEDRLLLLTQQLAAAQAREASLEQDMSARASALVARRHVPRTP